ncbi:hypothetical protein DPEC_G00076360 [Dallia pectoralis]|uniref:Uncharacterized protein n=1 Tax=Dallia pectoralis TaxID=75939 RepID=A0ACC2H3T7_DALPE|nr:hypothetical protein DPEC_G00076360 [Dallia pectoralis]
MPGDLLCLSYDMACPENMYIIGLFMSGVLIVFSKRDLITTMPKKLVVLKGSCVQIPCTFNIPEEHLKDYNRSKNVFGVWIKQSYLVTDNVIFNSSKEVNLYQGNITGNMSQKNCTTVFFNVNSSYTNEYYFRIESEHYRATDNEKYVNMKVKVYPVGTYNKTSEQTRTLHVLFSPKDTSASISPADPVSVGSCVNLTCTSTANPPVTNFTWFRISGGKTTQVASRQNYTLNVTVGDGGQYYCEARHDLGFGKSQDVILSITGQGNPKVWWIVGGTLVIVLLTLLIVFMGWKKRSKHERTDNPPEMVYGNQVYANQATTTTELVEGQSEEVRYGEINFSKKRNKNPPAAAQNRVNEEEIEYSEVAFNRRRTPDPEPPVYERHAQLKGCAF